MILLVIQRSGDWWMRSGPIGEGEEAFDYKFWQAQPREMLFAAAWDLVKTAWVIKGGDPNELRLQRSAFTIGPASG